MMTIIKYTAYIYLIASLFLFYSAYERWNDGTDYRWLFLLLGAACIVMFFVRRSYIRKMEQRGRS
jgi:hypothetical protein